MRYAAFGVLALLLMGASSVGMQDASWHYQGGQYSSVVEHQSGGALQPDPTLRVLNPSSIGPGWCDWDPDDHRDWTATGRWKDGKRLSASGCFIADWINRTVGCSGYKVDCTITVTDTLNPALSYTVAVPAGVVRCVEVKYQPDWLPEGSTASVPIGDAPYTEPLPYDLYRIPNSGAGGIGRLWSFTFTATAPRNTSQGHAHGFTTTYPERDGCPRNIDHDRWQTLDPWEPWADGLRVRVST